MGLDLTARKIRESFPLLLQCGNDQAEGLDATLRAIADGKGQDSVLDLSTAAAQLRAALRLVAQASPALVAGVAQAYANTAGELCARTPSGDYALTPPAPPAHPGMVAGRYYFRYLATVRDSEAMVADRIYLTPIFVPRPQTVVNIGIEVTGPAAAGKLIRLGLYDNGLASGTFNLLVDGGTVTADSAALKEVTISQPVSPGFVYVAAITDGTPTVRATLDDNFGAVGMTFLGLTAPPSGITRIYKGATFGALPATISGPTYNANSGYDVGLWVRI